jgi:phosphoribosylaminoimidazole carboxylase PurE protein
MGSRSDEPVMRESVRILKEFGVGYDMRILSAHRTPRETCAYAEGFRALGGKVFICGAGVSAALAGVVAAHTTLPVIGVPVDNGPLKGIDALLSTVQMPPGVPVGAVAIGKSGACNAALLAIRILSLQDESLAGKLEQYREEQRQNILNIDSH